MSAVAVCFVCQWCAQIGAERAGRDRLQLPGGFVMVPVPCAGAVPVDVVLRAFADGAEGVAVLGCHLGGCHHNQGNRGASVRLALLGATLATLGVHPHRLLVSFGSAHEGHQFASVVEGFMTRLGALSQGADLALLRGRLEGAALAPGCDLPPREPEAGAPSPLPADILEEARRLLASGEVGHVLGLAVTDGGVLPEVFSTPQELERAVAASKYPLAKTFWRFMGGMPQGTSAALVCRPCDARAVREQTKMAQYEGQTVRCLTLGCSEEDAHKCGCANPGVDAPSYVALPDPLADLDPAGRIAFWRDSFQRCIKCYGCRNVCPVCICPSCRLEDETFVPPGILPPPPLPWHACRALHVADRCVGCGACQDACPSGLPLLALHGSLSGHLHRESAYIAGMGMTSPIAAAMAAQGPCGGPPPAWGEPGGARGADREVRHG
ncbi:MAG: hydrogenase iron-sulfur subunit [Desulfovibrio sp.]|jgi:coenzyme F420-reducing hydrogenase delta subunit/ferredoxin|nr:hydrogenase iron-sulfur subunit [Desulfovibrio sp.]